MCNIRSMISNALKVIDRMQIQRNLCGLCRIHLALCKLDQILTQTALIFVDQIFLTLNLIVLILLIIIQKIHGSVDILAKFFGHAVHRTVTLSNCKCRVIDQTFFQKIEVCLILQFLCTVFHKHAHQFFKLRNKWKQNNNCSYTEHGIQCCDRYRSHDHIHKSEMHDSICGIEDDRPQNQAE